MEKHLKDYKMEDYDRIFRKRITIGIGPKIESTTTQTLDGQFIEYELVANPPHLPGIFWFRASDGELMKFHFMEVKWIHVQEEV